MALEKTISATDANRKFSQLLQGVRRGKSYIVTSHGRPLAKLTPYQEPTGSDAAWNALMAHLQSQPVVDVGPWTRDELYED